MSERVARGRFVGNYRIVDGHLGNHQTIQTSKDISSGWLVGELSRDVFDLGEGKIKLLLGAQRGIFGLYVGRVYAAHKKGNLATIFMPGQEPETTIDRSENLYVIRRGLRAPREIQIYRKQR